MVTFLTLFLGLTVGTHEVRLSVEPQIESVELLLDGEKVGIVGDAPWTIPCDFGDELRPHELVAVARDGEGEEVARARQRINLPRPMAEVRVILEDRENERYRHARVVWQAADESDPEEIRVSLDGTELEVEDPQRIELPPYDPRSIHMLSAELLFPSEVRARTELAFGGLYGEAVNTRLTAVPLVLRRGNEAPTGSEMEGWLRASGEEARIVGVERSPWDVLVVRDRLAKASLVRLGRDARRSARSSKGGTGFHLRPVVRRSDSLRFVFTVPRRVEREGRVTALFPMSKNLAAPSPPTGGRDGHLQGGVSWALTHAFPDTRTAGAQRLTAAVASAALEAAAGNRVRAVVLVKDPRSPLQGFGVAEVRRYLEALRVPFVVWATDEASRVASEGWGEVLPIDGPRSLRAAARDLEKRLETQFLVWLEGDYMPRDITLSEEAQRHVRFAG